MNEYSFNIKAIFTLSSPNGKNQKIAHRPDFPRIYLETMCIYEKSGGPQPFQARSDICITTMSIHSFLSGQRRIPANALPSVRPEIGKLGISGWALPNQQPPSLAKTEGV
ncbi:MAG: hypothetical protein CSA23_07385 [Deltaproteobacteria bacterium]|nr:MAG: hypothetical protein CSA23_07385 [Deltaproteobacteria bacterium]